MLRLPRLLPSVLLFLMALPLLSAAAIPADGARIRFDRSRVHVYADGRIVEGQEGGAA